MSATLCPDCHHTPSGRYANEYAAACYCKCHDAADAAPELLAACKTFVEKWDAFYADSGSMNPLDYFSGPEFDVARAAIKKAEGS